MTTFDSFDTAPRRHGLARLILRLPQLMALRRARLELAGMDATRLKDIGLTPQAARDEAARSFWDAPHHWLR